MVKIWLLLIEIWQRNFRIPLRSIYYLFHLHPTPNERESSDSISSFYFKKSKKKETKVNHEKLYDKLSQSLNFFMTNKAQNSKQFFKKLFGEKSFVESGDDNTSNKSSKFW